MSERASAVGRGGVRQLAPASLASASTLPAAQPVLRERFPLDERRHTRAAAAYLGLSAAHLERLRSVGRGPKYYRAGRKVFYLVRDLDRFIEACSGPDGGEA